MTQRNIPNSIKILCNIHINDLQVLIKPVCIHIEEKIVFQIPSRNSYNQILKISKQKENMMTSSRYHVTFQKKLVSFLHLAMDYSHAKFQVYRVCKKGIKEGGRISPPPRLPTASNTLGLIGLRQSS